MPLAANAALTSGVKSASAMIATGASSPARVAAIAAGDWKA